MGVAEELRATVSGDRGPWMVLAHGIGGRPRDWDPVVAAFAGDYRVVTFAQPGSTDAAPGSFSPLRHSSPMGFADDMGILCGELGIRDAVYVGHSIAGSAGVIAAVADPGLFSRLVLINASPCYVNDTQTGYVGGFDIADVDGLLGEIGGDYTAWAAGFGPQAMRNEERPALAAEFVDRLRALSPQIALATFKAALTTDLRSLYTRLTVPTLVLQGRTDPVVPVSAGHWTAEVVPSATLVTMDTAGHLPHIADPDVVIDAMRSFLGGSTGSADGTTSAIPTRSST